MTQGKNCKQSDPIFSFETLLYVHGVKPVKKVNFSSKKMCRKFSYKFRKQKSLALLFSLNVNMDAQVHKSGDSFCLIGFLPNPSMLMCHEGNRI